MNGSFEKESFMERVFLSINGQLLPEYVVPGVENIFEGDSVGITLYSQAREAYGRICDRLGVQDADIDLDIIVRNLEEIGKEMGCRMYRYGAMFGMRDE